uniref:N-domain of Clp chaperone n=1 Tax=Eustigmatophyceae sp. Chic 10/23 P-6w TaxID=1446905 RepID=A0A3R5T8X4_9STRA|nr:N-domain of Clp chaperone [Eustigmatophyceae sp. Chic 10/23 P-6w]QAA11624.1 N-domain of Clp chaperone [Eustigmatophyceae sp. Chic 10/23 P-6w]
MSIPYNKQLRFKKSFKRKALLSNDLKKALLIAFNEAKRNKIYVTPELLLYGLISQQNSIAAKLLSTTISEFRNNKNLTSVLISQRIRELNSKNFEEKNILYTNKTNNFSSKLWDENASTPWLSPEVKEILKKSFQSTLQSKRKIVVVNTKLILFELLSKELIRELLVKVIN